MTTSAKITISLCLGLVLSLLIGCYVPHDNTDPPGGRSGLAIYTDNATGCEYLSAGMFGGITPRIGKDGKPSCGK